MRTSRVEQTLRREVAEILVRGDLRDPRLRHAAAISITAVKVAADLGSALVYVDVLGEHVNRQEVLDGLNAGASAFRARLGGRVRLKRVPLLRFVVDESIEQGRRIEAVLAELHTQERVAAEPEPEADEPEPEADEPEPER